MKSNTDTAIEMKRSEKPSGCPDCGGTVYREPMCVAGGPTDATEGWACLDCTWYEVDAPVRKGRSGSNEGVLREGVKLGGRIEDAEADEFDEEMGTWHEEGGCPECGGTLEIYCVENTEEPEYGVKYEYEGFEESCSRFAKLNRTRRNAEPVRLLEY